ASSARSSSPTLPPNVTLAPSRAAATAWFAPLPPGYLSKVAPVTVSPGRGKRSQRTTKSRFTEPTTVSSGGKRAQVLDRAAEQVLAQVEEAGPERGAVRRRPDPGRVGEPGKGPEEDRELEVRLRHANRRDVHARTLQDGRPLEQLRGARCAVPGSALGAFGLELQEVAAQRALEPGQRRLRSVGRATQGGLATTRRRGSRVAAGPALQQPAERQCSHLAG